MMAVFAVMRRWSLAGPSAPLVRPQGHRHPDLLAAAQQALDGHLPADASRTERSAGRAARLCASLPGALRAAVLLGACRTAASGRRGRR